MSFWRSNTVNCYQLILPRENAHRIVQLLGRLPNLAFRHTNAHHHQKPFAVQLKMIEETMFKLNLLEGKLQNDGGYRFPGEYSREEFDAFLEVADRKYRLDNRSSAHLLEIVIEEITNIWEIQNRLVQRMEDLLAQASKLQEERRILRAGELLFGSRLYIKQAEEQPDMQISFKCGVIGRQDEVILRRTLFRMTKGLSIYSSVDYSDCRKQPEIAIEGQQQQNQQPQQDESKSVFFLIFGYGESRALSSKVQKLLENYNIISYKYPRSEDQSKQTIAKLDQKLSNNTKLVSLVKQQIKNSLTPLLQMQYSENKIKFTRLEYCKLYLIHQRKIYEKLNEMKLHHNFYEAFVFIETKNIQKVTAQLHHKLIDDRMPSPQLIPANSPQKPTLFQLNQFTRTPYQILSAYGIPRYKEANPALLNLTTFPFLFGVMFGDIAHGAILFAFGMLLIFNQTKQNQIIDILRAHRFTIALMGFFSFYCGLIYNDYLSLSLNIFGSCYQSGARMGECVYPVGIDPVWSISVNDLNFTNSLKMKIAVIIAIVHMTLGLVVKALNFWHLGKKMHIFIDLLPQIIFFLSLFGYMDFLIIYKWLKEWTTPPPSIITTMINIPLQLGATSDCCGGQPMWGTFGNTSQHHIQLFLLIVALASIPSMFFLPLAYEWLLRKAKKVKESQLDLKEQLRMSEVNANANQKEQLLQREVNDNQTPMNQLVIYQLIETIQFVLGCISNTASYLRLWALSLAHTQLSDVFFSQTVAIGLKNGFLGILYNLALFPIYAGISFGILMCMDSMQCFLHTLRLHWVQFQSKFYKGDGVQFKSSDFLTYLNEQVKKNPTKSRDMK